MRPRDWDSQAKYLTRRRDERAIRANCHSGVDHEGPCKVDTCRSCQLANYGNPIAIEEKHKQIINTADRCAICLHLPCVEVGYPTAETWAVDKSSLFRQELVLNEHDTRSILTAP